MDKPKTDIKTLQNKKITSALRVKIKELQAWVDQVLSATGHSEAYVTDKSLMWDLISVCSEEEDKEIAKNIGNKLGVAIGPDDYVFEVAERLRDRENMSGLGND